ncbi:MAG: hypothetical protein OXU20_32280, partial [Myxococcales bacterium]|nr:hypothetical protein [Myxococcales bacterium]
MGRRHHHRIRLRAGELSWLALLLTWGCHDLDALRASPEEEHRQGIGTGRDGEVVSEQEDPAADLSVQASTEAEGSCAAGACWWSEDPSDPCKSVGYPTAEMAPSPDTEGPDVDPIYLGWSRLWLGQGPIGAVGSEESDTEGEHWARFGFDLDGKCTASGAGCEQEAVPPVPCKQTGAELPYDGDACRDNTFARYQPLVAQTPDLGDVYGLTEAALNCSLHHGDYTMVTRVSEYNGELDDPEVRVDYYASPGLVTRPTFWQCPIADFAENYTRWKATAQWYIDQADLTADVRTSGTLPDSRRVATTAYVRGGYLVALSETLELGLPGDNSAFPGWGMRVQGAILVGKLTKGRDGTWSMTHGLVSGRAPGEDLVLSFKQLGLCPGASRGSIFDTIERYVLEGLDLPADGIEDLEAACDAMSVGVGFEAHQITPGPATEVNPRVNCCLPEHATSPSCPIGCGDGRVAGAEKCDTAISDGEQGACPSDCGTDDPCRPEMLVGEGCQAECVALEITAPQDDDGCCPAEAGATAANDSDCESVCGNGAVEPNETCDPPGSCPTETSCGNTDVCSSVSVTGDPAMCNSVCEFTQKTACEADDMCCPPGCDYAQDNDCPNP